MKLKYTILAMLICLTYTCCIAADDNTRWYGNDHFKISHGAEVVKVSMAKLPWESFSVGFSDVASAVGVLSIEIKTEEPVLLRIDGFTAKNSQVNLISEQILPGNFQKIIYNLAAPGLQLGHLIFYINPGREFKGEVQFKEVKIAPTTSWNENVLVYPNPVSDNVQVQLPNDSFKELLLYDTNGKLVHSGKPAGQHSKISLTGYKPGMYLLKAKGKNVIFTTKLIVR